MSSRRRRPIRALGLVAPVVVLVAVLSGCGPSTDTGTPGGTTPGSAGQLVLYSGRAEGLIKPVVEQFEKETGIDVRMKNGDSADLAKVIDTEGDAGTADVFLSQTAGAMGYVLDQGRLQPLARPVLDLVPAEAHDAGGKWVGVTGRARVLVYNTKIDKASLPTRITDVTGPAFKDRLGVAPTNASFQDFVSAMRAASGDDATKAFLEGLAGNGAKTMANNVAIVNAVAQGELDYGLVNHYYLVKAKKENPGIAAANHFFPAGDLGSMLNVSSVGILAGSKNKANAEKFVQFLLSAKAQQMFVDAESEYPLIKGVQPPADQPPLDTLDLEGVDIENLGDKLEGTITMIRDAGLAK